MDNKCILLCDDEPYYIEPLAVIIESQGYKVLKAVDGSECLRLIESNHVDVLVVDIMMDPGNDARLQGAQQTGIKVMELVREKSPDTYIVCLSVIADEEIKKVVQKNAVFLRKGETSLPKAWKVIESKIKGYSIFGAKTH